MSPAIARILVALDASAHSLSAARVAAQLAGRLDAEVRGIFVEEETLLRVARLAGVREVDALSAELRPVERRAIERQLRLRARRARRALEEAAARAGARWSFRTIRGHAAAELGTAAGGVDLLVLGARGWSPGRGAGSTVRALLRSRPAQLMVLRRGARLGAAVHALYDGSADARAALRLATRLAAPGARRVVVHLVAEAEEDRDALREEAAALAETGPEAEVVARAAPPGGALPALERLTREACGLVVLPASLASDRLPIRLDRLLRRLSCPLVVAHAA